MKKTRGLCLMIALVFAFSIMLTACSGTTGESEQPTATPTSTPGTTAEPTDEPEPSEEPEENYEEVNGEEEIRLTTVVDYFKKHGLEVGEVTMKAFEMMGAVDGFGIDVEGEQIELYLFDPETADEETLANLEDARSIGKFSMNEFSFPVTMNENIMLTRYDEHPEKDKIIEVFKQFN